MRVWVRRILRVGGWAVLFVAVGVLAATVVLPRAVGGHAYAVLSTSMEPTFEPGSVVVVRPVDVEDIAVGSIITFQLETGQPGVATHRVVTQGVLDDGGRIFRTQGDASDTTDQQWVRPVQVKGEVWYSVPYVGRFSNLLPYSVREIAVVLVAITFLVYAAVMFLLGIRERRRVSHA